MQTVRLVAGPAGSTASLALSISSTGSVGGPMLLGSLYITAPRRMASVEGGTRSRVAARYGRLGLLLAAVVSGAPMDLGPLFCFLASVGHASVRFSTLPFRPPTLGDLCA